MNKIYDDKNLQELPFIVGKMHKNRDWRRFVSVQKCCEGFHYFLVESNDFEKSYVEWVVSELPEPTYNYPLAISSSVLYNIKVAEAHFYI